MKVPAPIIATDNSGEENEKYTDEFSWLTETNEALLGATETLFEDDGKAEKGIVFLTKAGDIALTLSELKRLVDEIENPEKLVN